MYLWFTKLIEYQLSETGNTLIGKLGKFIQRRKLRKGGSPSGIPPEMMEVTKKWNPAAVA